MNLPAYGERQGKQYTEVKARSRVAGLPRRGPGSLEVIRRFGGVEKEGSLRPGACPKEASVSWEEAGSPPANRLLHVLKPT